MNTKAAAIAAQRGEDEIISVEETVWSLRLGARNPPCNIAKFEEVWVNTGDGKRKVRLHKTLKKRKCKYGNTSRSIFDGPSKGRGTACWVLQRYSCSCGLSADEDSCPVPCFLITALRVWLFGPAQQTSGFDHRVSGYVDRLFLSLRI